MVPMLSDIYVPIPGGAIGAPNARKNSLQGGELTMYFTVVSDSWKEQSGKLETVRTEGIGYCPVAYV